MPGGCIGNKDALDLRTKCEIYQRPCYHLPALPGNTVSCPGVSSVDAVSVKAGATIVASTRTGSAVVARGAAASADTAAARRAGGKLTADRVQYFPQ